MALILTKKITVVWDTPSSTDPERIAVRDALIDRLVDEGKTNGLWQGDATTTTRSFVDQASAEEWLAAVIANNPDRTLLSQTVVDL
jgi:hypothetical protein